MIALILTRAGFEDIRLRLDRGRDAIWVSAGVFNETEVADLRRQGFNLTVFAHRLDPQHLVGEIGTVVEHHPEQVVWVETPAG